MSETKGELVAERVELDVSPDRDADAMAHDAGRAAAIADDMDATLAMVDFGARANSGRRSPMRDARAAAGADVWALYPDAIRIDGPMFDTIAHFRAWQAFYEKTTAEKFALEAAIRAHLERHGPADATWSEMAARLSAEGHRTLTGKAWTTENVQKFMKA